jgi:helicase
MKQRSTWVALNHAAEGYPRWRRYLRLLARGLSPTVLDSRSVSELWPSQLAALEHGLLTDSASKVIKMPTSAGKTRVAELAIVYTLVTQPGSKCLYVAPFRALVNEVKDAFATLLSDLGYQASSVVGAYEEDQLQSLAMMEDDLLILTPEKLDLVLRLAPELVENVQLIVLDEGHIVGERSRGAKYELLITRLKRKLPAARFLFLSAVLPQETLEDFANWLKAESRGRDIVVSGWRPSIQRLAALEWSGAKGTLRYASEDDQALSEFVPSVIEQRVFEHVNPRTGRINRPRFPDEANKSQIAAALAFELASRGPILIFAVQPNYVGTIGAALARRIELAELTDEDVPNVFRARSSPAYEVATEWLGDTHDVTRLLHRGIALHHRQLPDAVKKAIEEDFRARRQQVVIATSTLAQGVNLPVRTVIVHSASRYNEESNRQEPIKAREYWNIAGRAGRAGEETHGTIIHIVRQGNRQDQREFHMYRRRRQNVEPIESALYQLLLDLRDRRISDDEAAAYLDAELLGILVEESIDFDDEDALVPLLGESLFSIQASRREVDPTPLYRTFHGAGRAIKERVGDESLLRLYAGTGLRSDSCEQIRNHVEANRPQVLDLLTSASITSVQALAQLFLEGLENIDEMQPSQDFTGSRLELLLQWISGSPITELVEGFPDAEMAPETVAKLVEDLFSYRLPWGISGYLRIASKTLEIEQLPPTVSAFPAMVKYGVPTPAAAWATGAGIPSRQLAIDLAANFITYVAQGPESELGSFRRWLAQIDVDQLREDFGLSGPLLEEAARVLSQVQRNDLLARIDEGAPLLPLTIEAPVLRYAFRTGLIGSLTEGTSLEVHRDLDDRLNRNAIYLAINGERLCFLPRAYAQLLAPEVDTGLALEAKLLQADLSRQQPTLTVEISQRDGSDSSSESASN